MTVAFLRLATQTEPAAGASEIGSLPAATLSRTRSVRGEIRKTLPACVAAQTSRPSQEMPAPDPMSCEGGSGIRAVTCEYRRSTRDTVDFVAARSLFNTHAAPAPTVIPTGGTSNRDRPDHATELRVDSRDRRFSGIRDPQIAACCGHGRGRIAHWNDSNALSAVRIELGKRIRLELDRRRADEAERDRDGCNQRSNESAEYEWVPADRSRDPAKDA